MKYFRICILLVIVLLSLYSWRRVYETVFALLDFQIWFYKTYLQTWEQLGNVKDAFGGVVDQALWLLWESSDSIWNSGEDIDTLSTKVDAFAKKITLISGVIWVIVWLVVWKILFNLVFWLRNWIQKIQQFIM